MSPNSIPLSHKRAAFLSPQEQTSALLFQLSVAKMTANTTTFGSRFATYKDALTGCENAVFDKDAARQPATEEKSKLFDEAVIDQGAVKQQTKSMACTLLRGTDKEDKHTYAILGQPTGLVRRAPDGQTYFVKVNDNVKNGKYLNESQLNELYPECIQGALEVGGIAGSQADGVMVEGVRTVLRPVATDKGQTLVEVRIDIGGVAGDGAQKVPIEEGIKKTGLRWRPTIGEPAKPEVQPVRGPLAGAHFDQNYLGVEIDKKKISGSDGILQSYMQMTGTIPNDASKGRTVGELAQYLCMAGGEAASLFPVGICLHSWQTLQEIGISYDETSEKAGASVIEAWALMLKSLTPDQIYALNEKKSSGGNTIESDMVPPNEAGAMINQMIMGVQLT